MGTRINRGSALLVTAVLMGVLLVTVTTLLQYAASARTRGIQTARTLTRRACVETGLQLARSYFGNNYSNWGNYLTNSSVYNPMTLPAGFGNGVSSPMTSAGLTAILTSNAALGADLDNDQNPDVYIYIRDNADEFPPLAPNPVVDNDMNVIVGAVCISQTLVPRLGDGTQDTDPLTSEALLQYNPGASASKSQAGGGSSGTGNLNN